MTSPLVTVVIPTHDRNDVVPRAVESALGQTVDDLEVVVVDDASTTPVSLPRHPRVRVLRLDRNVGNAGARNAGVDAAAGRWVVCVDDDDVALPHLVAVSLANLERTELPAPVAALSGVRVVSPDGVVVDTRLPPTRARGAHFFLEPPDPGRSYLSKQTLFVERDVLRSVGMWDASFRSRVPSELLLRLNPVCSILGIPMVTYELHAHGGPRVSRDRLLRARGAAQLIAAHQDTFDAHPEGYARFLLAHARRLLDDRQPGAAAWAFAGAARRAPRLASAEAADEAGRRMARRLRFSRRPRSGQQPLSDGPPPSAVAELRLITLAPLTWEAGHDVLLAAVAELAGRGLLLHLDVVVEGGADVDDRERLLFTAHDLGVAAMTVLHVAPSAASRQRLLANADVFVLAALHDRPWPALDEAMTHALPVAASDLASVRDRLSQHLPHRVAPPRRPRELADAVADLAAGIPTRASPVHS